MKQKTEYLKVKLALGSVSLVIGILAANFALFNWIERTGLYYLLGNYARYVCAYGGFAAMIFGAMLINDFLVFRTSIAIKRACYARLIARAWLIRARTEWLLARDNRKYFSLETEEEREVVAHVL
jgi:hypothetical protein